MQNDMERLCDAVAQELGYHDTADGREKAERIVRVVLEQLRTPSESMAARGGAAASTAMMGFAPPAMCGLAAVRGTIDAILEG